MRKLDVFDFDGTLFRTPENTHENRRKYERATGIPWIIDKTLSRKLTRKLGRHVGMRRGWWGRKETLEPPLVPDPTPREMFIQRVCADFHQSKGDPNTITMILTGRHLGLQHQVLRILDDGGLVDVRREEGEQLVVDPRVMCFFLGDDGPKPFGTKPTQTLPWKLWILEQYMNMHDGSLEEIEIWEDRTEHVQAFRDLDWGIKITVNHIREVEGV